MAKSKYSIQRAGDDRERLAAAEIELAAALAGENLEAATFALERVFLLRALSKHKGNTSHAAEALGLSRQGLLLKISRVLAESGNRSGPVGYVYVLRAATGHYKIGKTRRLRTRVSTLLTAGPVAVEFVGAVPCEDPDRLERQYHRQFAARRVRGEWFALTESDLATMPLKKTAGRLVA